MIFGVAGKWLGGNGPVMGDTVTGPPPTAKTTLSAVV
jgi:hypothetical protein